jgi:hypothetical protein
MLKVHAAAVAVLLAGSITGAGAKDCRVPDAPPGVQAPLPPGCRAPVRVAPPAKRADAMLKAGKSPGSIDLGNGSEVRIGGRVRVDTMYRR